MDIAAVQALGREEKREFSWKEGRKRGRHATEKERERAPDRARAGGPRAGACASGPRTKHQGWESEAPRECQPAHVMLTLSRATRACENPENPQVGEGTYGYIFLWFQGRGVTLGSVQRASALGPLEDGWG